MRHTLILLLEVIYIISRIDELIHYTSYCNIFYLRNDKLLFKIKNERSFKITVAVGQIYYNYKQLSNFFGKMSKISKF